MVQAEGNKMVRRTTEFYNLDVVISVGYRVKSKNGVAFRKWANSVLKMGGLDDGFSPFFGTHPFASIPPPWQASVPLESRRYPKKRDGSLALAILPKGR
ncbi:MAG: virulence RhuM family protein [Bacilli bacterium]|nr:virulence RhuM family protein [Bacilli bacterium]